MKWRLDGISTDNSGDVESRRIHLGCCNCKIPAVKSVFACVILLGKYDLLRGKQWEWYTAWSLQMHTQADGRCRAFNLRRR